VLSLVAETITRYNMLTPGSRVGVAVSGGVDSVGLLLALAGIGPRWNATLVVLHLNHRLRGAESDGDEAFVRHLAERLGLVCIVEQADIRGIPGNLEDNARRRRYAFFSRAAAEHRLDRVATGHTRGDQAETVLLRLLRGTGPAGLAAIRTLLPGLHREGADSSVFRIIRPLIECTRAQVQEYVHEKGERWREDSTNSHLGLARNRIRHRVLPLLRAENPAIDANLARLATLAAEDEQYWQAEIAKHLPALARPWRRGLVLDLAGLRNLHWALSSRILRAAIRRAASEAPAPDAPHLESIRRLLDAAEGDGTVSLPGAIVTRSFDSLLVARPAPPPGPYHYPLSVPGSIAIPGRVLSFRTAAPGNCRVSRYNTDGVCCDYVTAPGRLELRNWRPGDAYRPAGSSRPRKLKELFHRARIPSWERPGWPMITKEAEILWVLGFGPSAGTSGSRTLEVWVRPLAIEEPKWELTASDGI
jgi:tRNA(Ile)-lysidine synthase